MPQLKYLPLSSAVCPHAFSLTTVKTSLILITVWKLRMYRHELKLLTLWVNWTSLNRVWCQMLEQKGMKSCTGAWMSENSAVRAALLYYLISTWNGRDGIVLPAMQMLWSGNSSLTFWLQMKLTCNWSYIQQNAESASSCSVLNTVGSEHLVTTTAYQPSGSAALALYVCNRTKVSKARWYGLGLWQILGYS